MANNNYQINVPQLETDIRMIEEYSLDEKNCIKKIENAMSLCGECYKSNTNSSLITEKVIFVKKSVDTIFTKRLAYSKILKDVYSRYTSTYSETISDAENIERL